MWVFMAFWQHQGSACSHAATETSPSSPTVPGGMQQLPCCGGGCVNSKPVSLLVCLATVHTNQLVIDTP